MSYGILVNNASGFTQIDGTYDNISSVSSGTIARSYATTSGSQILNKVTFPSGTPADYLIFAKPSAQTTLRQITLAVYSDGFAFFAPWQASGNFNIDYFIGVRSEDMPANNSPDHGLEVYKANGDQAYSSNNPNFKVSAVSFDSLGAFSDTPASFSVSSMTGVYTLMSGKNFVGRSGQGYPNYSIVYCFFQEFDYTAKTIAGKITPVTSAPPNQSGSFGGGFKTNLIGTLT